MAIWPLNFIDVLMGLLFCSLIYYSSKNSFIVEIIKLAGSFIALILSFHYYARVGHFLRQVGAAPDGMHNIFAFLAIAGATILAFSIIQNTWCAVFRIKSVEDDTRWESVACGAIKSYIFCGLLITALFCSSSKILVDNIKNSAGKEIWGKGNVSIYHFVYSGLIAPLFPNEKINKAIFDLYHIPLEEKSSE